MAEYQMLEVNLPNEEGKKKLYPRMVMWNQVDLGHLIRTINYASSFSPGDIMGLVKSLTQAIATEMAMGHSVKIDGLGIFTPALGVRKGVEPESGEKDGKKVNAQSIFVENINFRADKQFILETQNRCTLMRSREKTRRSSQRYTPQQRLERAKEFLKTNTFIQIADYCRLTGLLRSSAAKELRRWAEDETSGITTHGRGSHKMYILRK